MFSLIEDSDSQYNFKTRAISAIKVSPPETGTISLFLLAFESGLATDCNRAIVCKLSISRLTVLATTGLPSKSDPKKEKRPA